MDDQDLSGSVLLDSTLDGYDIIRLCAASKLSNMFDDEEPASTSFRCLLPLGYLCA